MTNSEVVQQQIWNVQLVGQIGTSGTTDDVVLSGNYAYVTEREGYLRIIDVSNPAAPSETGFDDTLGEIVDVVVAGDYAYVAAQSDGMRIIDVSNPVNPGEIGFYDTPGSAIDVAVTGNYAYIADNNSMRVIDVSDPAAPIEIGLYDTPGNAYGVAVSGNYTYVADGSMLILRYAPYWTYLPCITRDYCSPMFADDFSDPSNGWPIGDDGTVSYEYLNDEYLIIVRNTYWWAAARPDFQASDYIMAADAYISWGEGSYGLIFGISDDWSQFYTFEIDPDGYYWIFRYDSGTWTSLAEGYSSSINYYDKNRLKIKREGTLIEAYVNGEFLASVSDGSYTGMRYMGLYISSYDYPYGLEVRFDDFVVYPANCNIDVAQIGETIQAPKLGGLESIEQGQTFSQPHNRRN